MRSGSPDSRLHAAHCSFCPDRLPAGGRAVAGSNPVAPLAESPAWTADGLQAMAARIRDWYPMGTRQLRRLLPDSTKPPG